MTPRAALLALAVAAAPPARAQLGIDLSEPPAAGRPSPPNKTGTPTKTATPHPAGGERELAPATATSTPIPGPVRDRLAAAERLLRDGRGEQAALAYDAVSRDPAAAEGLAEARLGLARALERLGLVRSAIGAYGDVLASAGGAPFDQAVDALFALSQRSGDEQAVLAQVGRLRGRPLAGAAEDRLHYLLAKHAYERAQALEEAGRAEEARKGYAEARRLAALVKGGARGDVFARARFLDGLAQYAEGNGQGALDAFREVVRLTGPRRAAAADGRLRELAFLQLARLHYEHRQNRYALYYYGRMPQAGASWLEGVWESSYAYYRIGDSERALGNLITLHSPYFQDEWFPESHVLKAIIYYENCRYPEARGILEEFGRRFAPVHQALARAAGRAGEPAAFFAAALEGAGEADPALARRIGKLALADGNVRRIAEAVRELDREVGAGLAARGAAFREAPLAAELRARLATERTKLAAEGGARARHQLDRQRGELRELLEQALRIKIEVSRREREGLEAQIARRGGPAALKDYRYSAAVSDEHLYWPYDGEFWRDELGTYAYTLTKGCRDAPGEVRASR